MENYFELFQLTPTLNPDKAWVKKQFYALSKKFHPDKLLQSGGLSQEDVLQKAAIVNKAYKTLSDEDQLMAYVLQLHQLLAEEEKYALPPSFLMEMMELNELVSDYEADSENKSLKIAAEQSLTQQLAEWEQGISPLKSAFETEGDNEELLLKIKDFYFRKKYLLRIKERLTTFASR